MLKEKDAFVEVIYNENEISSYGLSSPYNDGYKILLVSRTDENSLAIFKTLLSNLPHNSKVYLEVNPLQTYNMRLVKVFQMKEFSRSQVMYNKVLTSFSYTYFTR